MCENDLTQGTMTVELQTEGGESMVDMIPIVIDGREYVLRVVKDNNGKIIKGELCLPLMGGLAMVLKGDE